MSLFVACVCTLVVLRDSAYVRFTGLYTGLLMDDIECHGNVNYSMLNTSRDIALHHVAIASRHVTIALQHVAIALRYVTIALHQVAVALYVT